MKPLRKLFALVPDCHWRTPFNFSYMNWQRHIYDALPPHVERLVIPQELDYGWARQGNLDPATVDRERARTTEQLWTHIQRAHREHGLDAVFSYCFSSDLVLDVVRDTIKLGIPWINFYCDSVHMFERVEALARVASLNWFPETQAVPQYAALGTPFLCAPYALNPAWLPDLSIRQPLRNVAFVGQPTSNRITQLGRLRLHGCRVDIRGKGWLGEKGPFYSDIPARRRAVKALFKANIGEKIVRRLMWPLVKPQARGPLGEDEFFEYLKDSVLILGLNQSADAQGRLISYMKFRDMEFPGHGCCYLTELNEDIPNVFDIGKEILTFRSIGEAAHHIKRVGKDPALARQIGQAARRRVLEQHNWGVRLADLQKALG